MQQKRLRETLKNKSKFSVVVELTAGPDFSLAPVEAFLRAYKNNGGSFLPEGFELVGVAVPQNPGGMPNVEPANVLLSIKTHNLLGDLDFIPHISCKDQNVASLISSLAGFKAAGVETVLAITGDKPLKGKGVFEVDSLGLLTMLRRMNSQTYLKARPEILDKVHQFFAGAVVSPFKYTEASQMQQYYKMKKKIACGAEFLVTQVGWDWRKSAELFKYLTENNINIPVIGNVFLLSTKTAAPRQMHDMKLPGCFVSDELFEKVCSESFDEHVARAARQVAMYRSLGAAGVDIGSVHDYETLAKIITRSAEIDKNWQQYKDNLYWPKKGGFYLYDEKGGRVAISIPKRKMLKQRWFDFFHRYFFSQQRLPFNVAKKIATVIGAHRKDSFAHRLFSIFEFAAKHLMFECEMCGDCYLPENFGLCTIGGCEKGMDNAPCGDATVDGYCSHNLKRICIGEPIYKTAAAEKGGLEKLQNTINKPRNNALEHTSSILNFLCGKDHTMKRPLTIIGESINASKSNTYKIMKKLAELGPNAYLSPSGPLNYVKALIELQTDEGADYIAVNLDSFCDNGAQTVIDMLAKYIELVHIWGGGTPVCINSNDNEVLTAGLKEWFRINGVRSPLISSADVYTMDKILPLKKEYDFKVVCLLADEDSRGMNALSSVNELYSQAKRFFDTAACQYGFRPEEIFFALKVFPLAKDNTLEPGVPGSTYRTFETIRKIKSDRSMNGVHCMFAAGDCVRELPGRKIGVCRAYIGKAMEYGLDSVVAETIHQYGLIEPDPELLELVDAYAKMDGSASQHSKAEALMSKFCAENAENQDGKLRIDKVLHSDDWLHQHGKSQISCLPSSTR
jgi:methylenetetrahydrofolate reductase (NADPH)